MFSVEFARSIESNADIKAVTRLSDKHNKTIVINYSNLDYLLNMRVKT